MIFFFFARSTGTVSSVIASKLLMNVTAARRECPVDLKFYLNGTNSCILGQNLQFPKTDTWNLISEWQRTFAEKTCKFQVLFMKTTVCYHWVPDFFKLLARWIYSPSYEVLWLWILWIKTGVLFMLWAYVFSVFVDIDNVTSLAQVRLSTMSCTHL